MLLVLAVSLTLAALFYWRAFGMLRMMQWQFLLFLRAVAITIVVILLFRPVMSYHKDLEQKPALIFALDRSKSMSIADDPSGANRFAQARDQLLKWWEKLDKDFSLHLIEFSERARAIENIEEVKQMSPDGTATSLSRALIAAADRLPQKEVEAIIVLSDGIHNAAVANAAASPLGVAGKLGRVVHTVGVGATLRSSATYRDIQVVGVDCPDRLMLNNKAKVVASIEGINLGGHVTKAILEDNGQPIADAELTLDDIEGPQKVTFEFLPSPKGRHNYTVRVPAASEEKVTENNQRSVVALVVEPGIRVFYVEGTLRAEYGALVERFLSKDPDLEFCALVRSQKNSFLRRTNMADIKFDAIPSDPESINKFDVFLIGDIDSSFIQTPQQEAIVKRIQDGAGLLMLGGYHSLGPGGYDGTPIGEILPVRPGSREIGQFTDPILTTLTPDGAAHPIFSNVVGFFGTKAMPPKIAGLPPLDGCTRVDGLRPDATLLAYTPTESGELPILALHSVGRGRSAVFTGDTTRKWQQGPRALDQETPFMQFWGQMIRWLAGRAKQVDNEASIVASTDKGFYEPEDKMKVSAIVRDQKGEGTNDAAVNAKVTGPNGRPDKVAMSPEPGPAGHYSGSFDPKEPGKYTIIVEAAVGEANLKAETIQVEVGRPNLEFEKLDLDEKLLARIASDTGGRYVHVSTSDHLIEQLNRTQRIKRLFFEKPLYWPPLLWTLFVAALTTEWVMRKRFQLR